MMKTAFIYFLKDPTDPNKGYVGKTTRPKERLPEHYTECRNGRPCYRTNWLNSLTARGLKPAFEVIDEVPDIEWEFWEREYIRLFRAIGFQLVNGTDGGDAPPSRAGIKRSLASRRKQSASMTGKKLSPSHVENSRLGRTGLKRTAAQIERNRLTHLGKTLPATQKEKIGIAARNKKENNTSGIVGVGFHKKTKKWRARLTVNGQEINFGLFKNFEDAVFVRRLAEDKYFA